MTSRQGGGRCGDRLPRCVNTKKDLLDLCQTYKIGVIARSNIPMWWGDNGERAGQYRETLPIEKLNVIKQSYRLTRRSGAITRSTSPT